MYLYEIIALWGRLDAGFINVKVVAVWPPAEFARRR